MKRTITSLITFLFFFINSAISAQVSTSLSITDTRSLNEAPNFYNHSIRADFKLRDVIGVPGQGVYSTTLSFAQWGTTDNSGDKNHQLNFNNGGIFYRNAYPLDPQWSNWQQILMANSNGNVGIGTTNPLNRFQIGDYNNNGAAKISIPGTYNFEEIKFGQYGNGLTGFEFITHTNVSQSYGVRLYSGTDTGMNGLHIQTANPANSYQTLDYTTRLAVTLTGNVGIGTTNPQNKLDVNGTIHSKEVKVDMIGWSDFVFKKEYHLPTLEEVEKHIKEKGYLENIPSEEDVLKNGINLGEMNAKLLQKIEEMTLYMIDFKKEMNELKIKNEIQEEEIKKLKKINKI